VQIDWFTLGAQIVNFLILVALLRRFLYRPIVRTMDRREQAIAAQIEEAERSRQEAKQEAASFRAERQAIEERREELLAQAKEDAAERRHELIEETRAEVEESRKAWQATIQREKDAFLRDLQERVGEQIVQVARRALADLADVELEHHLVRVFASRLGSLDPQTLADSLGDSHEAVIYSAFELPAEARQHLADVVQQQVGDHLALRFEVEQDLIGGLLLKTSDYQLGWNLRNYLDSLEERLVKSLRDGVSAAEEPVISLEEAGRHDTAGEAAE
jgi:F-type H+-transporting ATPase subunit b